MRKINEYGLAKIKQWEGLKLEAYQDSGGVWTIGYGHTSAAGLPKVTKGMRVSESVADEILKSDLNIFEKRVNNLVKVPLSDNQFSTLVSFDLNTGKLDSSTLLKKLNKGDYASVPQELMKWVYVKGVKNKGLVNRRSAECGLWATGEFVSSRDVIAAPEQEKVTQSKDVQAASIAGIGAFGTACADAASQIAPFTDALPVIRWAFIGLTMIGIGFGLYTSIQKIRTGNA